MVNVTLIITSPCPLLAKKGEGKQTEVAMQIIVSFSSARKYNGNRIRNLPKASPCPLLAKKGEGKQMKLAKQIIVSFSSVRKYNGNSIRNV